MLGGNLSRLVLEVPCKAILEQSVFAAKMTTIITPVEIQRLAVEVVVDDEFFFMMRRRSKSMVM